MMLAMPDHIHGIVVIPHANRIQLTIASFKRDIGYSWPTNWQRDAFDHRIRNYEQLMEIRAYIRANPVQAGFIAGAEDWAYAAEWPTKQVSC